MVACRECGQQVSAQAFSCPHCGAPYPAKARWDGWGYEYKSQTTLFGLPLIHVSFKYRPNKTPVVAKGIISIGQFGMGIVNISQFGIGLFSLSQFTIAGYAIAQFGIAWKLIAQVGLYFDKGYGQFVYPLMEVLQKFLS
ncbi:MAG: zinc ribbon domain-containing protein [Calditrichaeota bacterium]|nr:MAG: zinc ribbon domain-containing protein [Calditrichota bacterium]